MSVYVLAIDSSTAFISCGIVEVSGDELTEVGSVMHEGARSHAELLMPSVLECITQAGINPGGIEAVIMGRGPGPFTGLRVGMATALACADAWQVPCLGVPTHHALAHQAARAHTGPESLVILTDARRREAYWSAYTSGCVELHQSTVSPVSKIPRELIDSSVLAGEAVIGEDLAAACGREFIALQGPSPSDLVKSLKLVEPSSLLLSDQITCASNTLLTSVSPMYLRRADAQPPRLRAISTALVSKSEA